MFTFVYLYEWMTTFKYSRFFKNVGISVSNINVFYPHSNNLYFREKRHKLLLLLYLTHVKWPSADRCMNNVQNGCISNCQESITNVCMVILNRTHPLTESRASIEGCPFNVHLIWSFWMHLNSSSFFLHDVNFLQIIPKLHINYLGSLIIMMHVDMPTFENVVGLFSCRHLLRYVMESETYKMLFVSLMG